VPRHMRWLDKRVNIQIAEASQTLLEIGTEQLEANERRGLTLTRMLIHLWVSDAATIETALGSQMVDLGIAVIDADALSASVVPDPAVEEDFPPRPWVWRDQVYCRSPETIVAPFLFPEIKVEVSSQRKLGNGAMVLVVDSNRANGIAFTVRVTGLIRSGYLLP